MHRVAFLTAAHLCEEPSPDPVARHEHELQLAALQRACEPRGVDLRPVVWTDPAVDPGAWDAAVIGTTWDYAEDPEAFLARLAAWSAQRPLFNPLATVRWNMNKTYLRDLASRGVPVVPTLWRERAERDGIAAAFDELETDTIVVKPVVGQHSWRQVRLRRGEALPPPAALPPAEAMIQPFLPSVREEGELSFVCFDRALSHGLRKLPAAGDYRVQASFGGREQRHAPTARDQDLVREVLAAVEGPLLHARVDLIRNLDGKEVVMELELIEPYLFPEQGDGAAGMGERFAEALLGLLGAGVRRIKGSE